MNRLASLVVAILVVAASAAAAQTPSTQSDPPLPAEPQAAETTDVIDLWRKLRHKDSDSEPAAWDYRKPMVAFAPVIGAKPSSGMLLGAAGNVAFYRGDPATTHISSRWQA